MERLKERLFVARKAWTSLYQVLQEPKTAIVRDATIQRFEFTFEAVWKTAQLFLREAESIEAGSPKATIRALRQIAILEDEQARIALRMADDRNLTVHTYNEDLAEQIYERISAYTSLMDHWLKGIEERVS